MKNIIVNTVGQLTSTLVSFICRIVFVWTLGKEYLGVSSLFTNILTLFSVAELGIGFAINFSMYKPLAEHDRKKVGALMGLYKRAYHIIGLIVAIAGLALAPFYRFLSILRQIYRISRLSTLCIFSVPSSLIFSLTNRRSLTPTKKIISARCINTDSAWLRISFRLSSYS
jgi:O-antigen/teichoic acid export membrane protein